jgi:hypothetical protein
LLRGLRSSSLLFVVVAVVVGEDLKFPIDPCQCTDHRTLR